MEERLDELKVEAKQLGSQEIIVGNIATSVGQGATYSSSYKALSQISTHITPVSLLPFLTIDEKNQVVGFEYGPTSTFLDLIVFEAIYTLQAALNDFTNFHKLDDSDLQELDAQVGKYLAIHAQALKKTE